MPLTAFEGEEYYRYTRAAGEYYCFEVPLEELGPQWFEKCNEYLEENHMRIDHSFDMEYYDKGYIDKLRSGKPSLDHQSIKN